MPAGEMRAGDVADLAALNQIVERPQCLLDWSQRVEAMHRINVYVIRLEPAQTGFASADQMMARRTGVIRAFAHRIKRLGRNQSLISPALDRFAENLLRQAVRI